MRGGVLRMVYLSFGLPCMFCSHHCVPPILTCISPCTTGKWARGFWAGNDEQEVKVKEETGATLRCFPLEQEHERGTCFFTGEPEGQVALFAKAY